MGDRTVEYYDMAASDAAPADSTTDEAPGDETLADVEQAGTPEAPPRWAAPLAGAVAVGWVVPLVVPLVCRWPL